MCLSLKFTFFQFVIAKEGRKTEENNDKSVVREQSDVLDNNMEL